jgi:hypothetical protein
MVSDQQVGYKPKKKYGKRASCVGLLWVRSFWRLLDCILHVHSRRVTCPHIKALQQYRELHGLLTELLCLVMLLLLLLLLCCRWIGVSRYNIDDILVRAVWIEIIVLAQ